MSLFSALRRKPEEDDLYDEYEPIMPTRRTIRVGRMKGSSRFTV